MSSTPPDNQNISCYSTLKLTLSDGCEISYNDAVKEERNLLFRLRHRTDADRFADKLWAQRTVIRKIVARHLRVHTAQCVIEDPGTWSRGQFNICVYVQVTYRRDLQERKVFRCPMPHKLGRPQSVDEKIRSEVANYAWIERYCSEIPVAHLIGFGFSNNHQYTSTQHLPWYQRLLYRGDRLLRAIYGQDIYPYIRHQISSDFGPYLLMDFIGPSRGMMLSQKWNTRPKTQQTLNLYRGLSRIILSLARIPQSYIGSLRFNDNRTVMMSQRPLLCGNILLESEGAPGAFSGTYPWSGLFLADFMDFRAKAFLYQPNAINDKDDCHLQMSHLVTLRAILPEMVDFAYSGPFILQHTDLHQSNIFVDNNWNVTGLIDLEFLCSLPPDMLNVPHWLSEESIDTIDVERYTKTCESFLDVLDSEAKRMPSCLSFSASIRGAWKSGAFWCYQCLTSINAMPMLMEQYIHPMYNFSPSLAEENEFASWLSLFWSRESKEVVQTKMTQREEYYSHVGELYCAAGAGIAT